MLVIHVTGRVMRCINDGPDALSKAMLATACIPGAAYEHVPGPLPEEGDALEEFAQSFKSKYLDTLADTFLASHEEDEPVTKVEKPSGPHRRISLVEN